MIKETFTDATFVRSAPVDPSLKLLQELGLEVQQILEIDKYRLYLILGEHVRAPSAFSYIAFRDVSQNFNEISLGLDQLANYAGSHLLVRQKRNTCAPPQLRVGGAAGNHRRQAILDGVFLTYA